jgi:hypothetical protein
MVNSERRIRVSLRSIHYSVFSRSWRGEEATKTRKHEAARQSTIGNLKSKMVVGGQGIGNVVIR